MLQAQFGNNKILYEDVEGGVVEVHDCQGDFALEGHETPGCRCLNRHDLKLELWALLVNAQISNEEWCCILEDLLEHLGYI